MQKLFLKVLTVLMVILAVAYTLPTNLIAEDQAVQTTQPAKEDEKECPCGYDEETKQCLPCPDDEAKAPEGAAPTEEPK